MNAKPLICQIHPIPGAYQKFDLDFYTRTSGQVMGPSGEVAVIHHFASSVTPCYVESMPSLRSQNADYICCHVLKPIVEYSRRSRQSDRS